MAHERDAKFVVVHRGRRFSKHQRRLELERQTKLPVTRRTKRKGK